MAASTDWAPQVTNEDPSAADAEDKTLSGISIVVPKDVVKKANSDVVNSMADYVGGKKQIVNSTYVENNDTPNEMAWAACGDLSIMGLKAQDACFGESKADDLPGLYFGAKGWSIVPGPYPESGGYAFENWNNYCEPTTGTCVRPVTGHSLTSLQTSATKCIWPQPGGISNVYYGCADTMQLIAPAVAEEKSCVDQHECMAVSLVNLADYAFTEDSEGVLAYDSSVSVPATTAVCKIGVPDPSHGYGKGSSNLNPTPRTDSGSSPLSWAAFRSSDAVGGDTRIQTKINVTWASDGNCDSPDGAATYSVNWDPRDGKGQLGQECQTTKRPVLANGYEQECNIVLTYNEDKNYVTWADIEDALSEKAQEKAEEASESLWDSLTGTGEKEEEAEEEEGNVSAEDVGGYLRDLTLMLTAGDRQLITQLAIQTVSAPSGLKEGQTLSPGEKLTSPNGETVLSLTKAGNVTLTDGSGKSSNLNNTGAPVPGSTLKLQNDLNLVLTTPDGKVNWAAGTDGGDGHDGTQGGELSVTDDGTATISYLPTDSAGDRDVVRTFYP